MLFGLLPTNMAPLRPVQSLLPVEITVDGFTEPAGNAITRYTSFFNMTGHPAITLPCGMHSAGLPVSAQLVGRHHADEALIETARLIEEACNFELPLPGLE